MSMSFYERFATQISYQRSALGDLRDGAGTSISDHGLRVALMIERTVGSETPDTEAMVLAGLFHDVLEDTPVTAEELLEVSSVKVVSLVEELTISFEGCSIENAVESLARVSTKAILIKCADITDNVEKSRFYLTSNTEKFYTSFFLPLLAEYERLIGIREANVLANFPEGKILLDRVKLSSEGLKQEVNLFTSLGYAL